MQENERLASQGLRVLATARRDFDPATFDPNGDLLLLMQELTLLTLVGIVDPPRAQARDAIAAAHDAGIQVRMITGDHAVTAQAIATQLGIKGRAITGAEWAAMSDEEAHDQIADIGVIARVAPSDKVRLVDVLKTRGEIVAMTGDGVNDAPALKKADIGIAMGITGTEVSKEAAVMILTDDNFATIVKAVELGRGLYDNLKKYIRFQIAVLIGFIVSFLGASLLNIVSGVPFLPLQTLWINFTVDLFLAIGLGYGKPAEGLMKRKPRASDEEVLPRPLLMWLASVGLLMGIATLAVIALGARNYDDAMGRTMGLVVFSLMHIVFAAATKDEDRSLLSLDFITDRPFMICAGLSMLAVILQTSMDVLQRILSTGNLELQQWLACIGITLVFAAFCEIGRLIRRRHAEV
jgi:Ca2+-transporting ATPase